MSRTKFLLLGGFLGAGKTTLLMNLAQSLRAQGLRVAAITNDQGQNLIDTRRVAAEGIVTEEVLNGCFCCRFDQLVSVLHRIIDTANPPDYVIAEAVGSCTDLTATVIKPMQMQGHVDVLPLTVVVDPARITKVFDGTLRQTFTEDLRYLYNLQLSEASVIVLSKADIVPPSVMRTAYEAVAERFPGRPLAQVSLNDAEAIAHVLDVVSTASIGPSLDIDYDRYAAAEAAMGWFDSMVSISPGDAFDAERFLHMWLNFGREQTQQRNSEIGHVKVTLKVGDQKAFANLVATNQPIRLQLEGSLEAPYVEGMVNARVALDPNELQEIMVDGAERAAQAQHLHLEWKNQQAFAPARPAPTYRIG